MPALLFCPKCHQPIRHERLGVPMPPVKCVIIDTIKAAGDIGISSIEVRNQVYGVTDRHPALIRVHVGQINDLLIGTDYRIVPEPASGTDARWFLRRTARVRGSGMSTAVAKDD